MNEKIYNYKVAESLHVPAIKKALAQLAGNNASFKKFFAIPNNQKVIQTLGNSTANNGSFSNYFIKELSRTGDILEGFDLTTNTTVNPGNSIGKMRTRGSNGKTLRAELDEGYLEQYMDLDQPNLVILRLLINDIRTGTSVEACRKMVKEALQRILTKNPDICIMLCIENSLGADEQNADGSYPNGQLITTPQSTTIIGQASIPPGEVKLSWGPVGRPTSIDRVGQEVIIAKGTANEEVCKILAINDLDDFFGNPQPSFTVKLTKTQTANATIEATNQAAAQAYSTALRESILPFINCHPQVVVVDLQLLEYGLEPGVHNGSGNPETSYIMNDPLHPSIPGAILEASLLADVLRKMYYKDLF